MHRSGFVSIIGKPNVGKSTLWNQLVGEELSIVTAKAQTTRHRIIAVLDDPEYQIVFSDTPGILKPAYALQQAMALAIEQTIDDTDIYLLITDPIDDIDLLCADEFTQKINLKQIPIIIVINKIDTITQEELIKQVEGIQRLFPQLPIIPVSAQHGFGIDQILRAIIELLPEGPKYYPENTLTDRPTRFFVSEIIRKHIFLNCQQEVPYCTEVQIEHYDERHNLDYIEASIHVVRQSQKGILIGKKGSMLRTIGEGSRKEIENFIQKKVFLHLTIKLTPQWRSQPEMLKQFGYIS